MVCRGLLTLPTLNSVGRSPPPLHAVRILAGGLQQSWMFKCTSACARRILGAQVRGGNLPLSCANKQIAYRRTPPPHRAPAAHATPWTDFLWNLLLLSSLDRWPPRARLAKHCTCGSTSIPSCRCRSCRHPRKSARGWTRCSSRTCRSEKPAPSACWKTDGENAPGNHSPSFAPDLQPTLDRAAEAMIAAAAAWLVDGA
ncbi:hypothetical protein CAFEA_01830 [Corynebacterium afermentans subsp. afermentans]|uniref:Uncharacterized protein n=1 Tax=Corynebacterium afermentans TaxID=38286 RepID=A0A9X8WIA8_9CORY|nr:hypothetical protein CAFEA_01830 [Corynebacterium afermentans subsp. afermentans]SIQ35919.1 hypothetical protein SAMN05421802_11229 [Corynebacterium afermentans]